jgi:transporter family protein
LLAIFAAICWGLAPIVAKTALRNVSTMMGMGIRSMLAAGLVMGWLLVSGRYKYAATDLNPRSVFWFTVEALLATVVGDAAYFYALKHGHAGHVSLIMATSPLITLLTAVLLLDEPVTGIKVIGGLLIMAGLILVGV